MSIQPTVPLEVEYPSSDGKPMAESDIHRDWMLCIIGRLKRFFAGQRVYVSGNLLVYYVEGQPRRSVAPDTFVVKDCDPRRRLIYKVWEEGKGPNFVLETTSRTTRRADLGPKMSLYARLQVGEYFLYDPLGDWLDPPLMGFRLVKGNYKPIAPDSDGGIQSRQLGVTLRLEDGQLKMYETATGMPLLSDEELAAAAEKQAAQAKKQAAAARKKAAKSDRRAAEAEQRLAQEAAARKALEEELARLKAERGQ